MALRLEVLSEHRRILGEASTIVFGVGGGSFGRASDNDWVLPDPQRYLSGHHGRIHFRQGAWYLEDLSTNGTYVNDSTLPVARTGPYALKDGDVLRFGEYEVRATIDPVEPAPAGTGATGSLLTRTAGTSVERVTPVRVGGAEPDLGASLNFEALIHADGLADFTPVPIGPRSDATEARLQRLRAAARARLEGHIATAGAHDPRGALQAFFKGAGLEPSSLPADADLRLLHLAGQLIRELLLGMQDLARARGEFQLRYGISADEDRTAEPGRPDIGQLGADRYLLRLIEGHDRHEFDALLVLREDLKAAAAHDTAVGQAVPEAVRAFIAPLAPEEIQSRFDAAADRGTRGTPWELYAEIYRTLTQLGGAEVPHLLAEALAEAYRAALRSKGGD